MKVLALLAASLFPFAAVADAHMCAYGRWQNMSPEDLAKLEQLDQSFTEVSAKAAQIELDKRLGAKLTDPARRSPGTSKLVATIEGWLLKKELLAARARREHDADEVNDYCWFLRRQAGIP